MLSGFCLGPFLKHGKYQEERQWTEGLHAPAVREGM